LLDIEKKTTGIHFVELKYNNRTTIRKLVIERIRKTIGAC
jgi:hypothetical protein